MTNNDKQFFRGLMSEFGQKWDVKLNSLDRKWDVKFTEFKDELSQEIRNNGVRIELLQDEVSFLAGEVHDFNSTLSEVRTDVAEIKENIIDLPVIRKLVKQHERQLSKMR